MGLFDDVVAGLRKGLEVAREKGELGVGIARVRLELAGLSREREGLYGRLGRMVFENREERAGLEPLFAEIERVNREVAARELSLTELGQRLDGADAAVPVAEVAGALDPGSTPQALPATATPDGWNTGGSTIELPETRAEATDLPTTDALGTAPSASAGSPPEEATLPPADLAPKRRDGEGEG